MATRASRCAPGLPLPFNLVQGGLALYSISVFTHAVFGLDLNLRIVILAATERLCILFRDTLLAGDEGYRAAPGLAKGQENGQIELRAIKPGATARFDSRATFTNTRPPSPSSLDCVHDQSKVPTIFSDDGHVSVTFLFDS